MKLLISLIALLAVHMSLKAQPVNSPRLKTPSDQSILQVPGTSVSWEYPNAADYYILKVATDSLMKQIVFQDDSVPGTQRMVRNLKFNSSYYWTVQAVSRMITGPVQKPFSFMTMPDNPHAVKGHPRILITAEDLPVLQRWAIPGNPIYSALKNMLNSAISTYNTKFYPGGVENPNWPDPGNTTWSGFVTEQYAEFFAFWSLIDPNIAERPIHARRARNLLMYAIDQALKGPSAGLPFRDPGFMTYDRSRVYGEAFGLTVDWIYNARDENQNFILTSADKAKIRTVFLRWCTEQLTAYNHPTPIGLINDKRINLTDRWVLNNYFSGHARNMTFMALSMDAEDDPPLDTVFHYSALGNSLRSFIFNATGAWLYQQYAQYELPQIVLAEYGVNPTGLGMGSGGLSVEGSLYGESIGWVAQTLLALKTAGWADENIIGKQIGLLSSEYWTRLMDGLIHSIAPIPYVPKDATYYGEIYPVANYGDLLRTWMTPFMIDVTAPISLIDMRIGNHQNRLDKARWFTRNALEGGEAKVLYHINNIWAGSSATSGLYYFLMFPPDLPATPDPRPAMNTTFWDPSWQKLLSRTDWTAEATWFNWQCHWTKINHQAGDGNQFEFYRKGEWLTKERSGYTNDNIGTTSEFHNTLALKNDVPPSMQWYEGPISERGGQWKEGLNAGDPVALKSIGNDYAYATGVSTPLYNRYSGASDIEHASRSIFWLKPDHIFVYDRAQSKSEDRFKRFFLQFTAAPQVQGRNATIFTPGHQKLFLSNLLPEGAKLTPSVSEKLSALAEQEFTTHQIKIEDPSNPKDIRFLNILQGADSASLKDDVLLVQSIAGTAFEGAALRETCVLMIKNWDEIFTNTSFSVPHTVKFIYVTGVKPYSGYRISAKSVANQTEILVNNGTDIFADDGGVILIDLNKINTSVEPKIISEDNSLSLFINPNPSYGCTKIQYNLTSSGLTEIELLDLSGRKVAIVLDKKWHSIGSYQIDFCPEGLDPGVYICLLSNGLRTTRKMLVLLK
ncbi:MAG: hypothetical protein U0V49_14270 [Saprospiraceae bacterium]